MLSLCTSPLLGLFYWYSHSYCETSHHLPPSRRASKLLCLGLPILHKLDCSLFQLFDWHYCDFLWTCGFWFWISSTCTCTCLRICVFSHSMTKSSAKILFNSIFSPYTFFSEHLYNKCSMEPWKSLIPAIWFKYVAQIVLVFVLGLEERRRHWWCDSELKLSVGDVQTFDPPHQ